MPTFRYVATQRGDAERNPIRGEAEALNYDDLREKLSAVGFHLENWETREEWHPPGLSLEELVENVGEIGVIQLADALLQQAIHAKASDIHIEPRREGGLVRFRVDGVLLPILNLPESLLRPLTARYKLMAKITAGWSRFPPEGAIAFRCAGREYDVRVSALWTLLGESLTCRIFSAETFREWTLEKIGLAESEAARAILSRRQGLVLFVGPVGSGKTSVMYAALHSFDSEKRNLILIADELSFRIEGVNRTPPVASVPDAVRDLLERDPDVLAIGELKRRGDAEAALEAAQSGRLALAVLQSSDALHAPDRLKAMGISPSDLASGLAGILSSRLARRVCPKCAEPYQPEERTLRELGISPERAAPALFRRGRGCDNCHGTGYRGRLALFEIVEATGEVVPLLKAGASAGELRDALASQGFQTARESGARKVLEGATTPEEVLRVTS